MLPGEPGAKAVNRRPSYRPRTWCGSPRVTGARSTGRIHTSTLTRQVPAQERGRNVQNASKSRRPRTWANF